MYSSTLYLASALMEWVVNVTLPPLYPRERDLLRILWEAWWAPDSVCTDAENIPPTGIR